MNRELVFLPEVTQDFIEAFKYYETLSPGSGGARLEVAFRQALQDVERGVVTHFRPFEHFHRVILLNFHTTFTIASWAKRRHSGAALRTIRSETD